MRELHFNIGVVLVVAVVVGVLLFTGTISLGSLAGMFGAVGFNIALLLSVGFGLQYFQLGTKFDIQKEIVEEHNLSLAVLQASIWIALAIVIAKGM
jgi:hypothetical protein